MKISKLELVKEVLIVVIGNLVIALGVTLFILPSDILSGGVAGIAVALQPVFHLPPTLVIDVMTVGLYLLGALVLGKAFALKTLVSTIVYPLFITVLNNAAANVFITNNSLLAAIYAGVFVGIGIGLVYRVGGSTGGMDIPPLVINKYTGLPLPMLVMIIDGLTVLLGMLTYGVEAAMIGLVSVWICGQIINKVITLGSQEAKNVMIISQKHDILLKEIFQNINRGATILHATGGYSLQDKPVIMMIVYQKQYAQLNRIISHVDPDAFVIVSDVNEVQGEGFTYREHI